SKAAVTTGAVPRLTLAAGGWAGARAPEHYARTRGCTWGGGMSEAARKDRRRAWAGRRRQGALAAVVVVGLTLGLTLLPAAPGAAVVLGAPTAGIIPFTAAGAAPAAIQGSVDAFRAALGGANNGVGGTFPNGRR